jgi:anti-anti-sigma regulatory factor
VFHWDILTVTRPVPLQGHIDKVNKKKAEEKIEKEVKEEVEEEVLLPC